MVRYLQNIVRTSVKFKSARIICYFVFITIIVVFFYIIMIRGGWSSKRFSKTGINQTLGFPTDHYIQLLIKPNKTLRSIKQLSKQNWTQNKPAPITESSQTRPRYDHMNWAQALELKRSDLEITIVITYGSASLIHYYKNRYFF